MFTRRARVGRWFEQCDSKNRKKYICLPVELTSVLNWSIDEFIALSGWQNRLYWLGASKLSPSFEVLSDLN